MKTLYLVRHAQAHSGTSYDRDHARELTADGERDARRLGRFLSATDQIPDRLVASTAVRARDTASLLPDGGQWAVDVPLRTERSLYDGEGEEDVLRAVHAVDAEAESALLVGHQPTWGDVVRRLAGDARVRLPTGAGVRIDVSVDTWTEVAWGAGVVEWVLPPRLLR